LKNIEKSSQKSLVKKVFVCHTRLLDFKPIMEVVMSVTAVSAQSEAYVQSTKQAAPNNKLRAFLSRAFSDLSVGHHHPHYGHSTVSHTGADQRVAQLHHHIRHDLHHDGEHQVAHLHHHHHHVEQHA
jgi:hypothetical protein